MPLILEDQWVAAFLLSEANLYRSRDVVTVPQGGARLPPGTPVTAAGAPATSAGAAAAILLYPADPTAGPVRVTAVTRDCEVNDAYLVYGEMDRAAVNAALAEHGIIVRRGVLADSINAHFGTLRDTPTWGPEPPAAEPPETP